MTGLESTHNADTLARTLHESARTVGDLEATHVEAGEILAGAPPPRRTGRLGAGVVALATPNGVAVASTAPYWTYVHYGAPGIHVKAQPWLADQLETHQAQILDLYRDHITEALRPVQE